MTAVYLAPVYLIVNICLMLQIYRWLQVCNTLFEKTWVRGIFFGIYIFLALSVLTAFLLPAGCLQRMMKLICNYWLGILLYMVLAVFMADIFYFACLHTAGDILQRYGNGTFQAMLGGVCAVFIFGVSAWGSYNARVIHVTPYEITVDKDGGKISSLNVVLVSDLHLGYSIGTCHMSRMAEKINEQNADLVVIAGDIFDNEYEALENPEELEEIFRSIRSKYGVYACYGNHDIEEKILAGFTFGEKGAKKSSARMDEFLERSGIRLLRDEAELIDGSFYLYGRPVVSRPGRGIAERKTAAGLMRELSKDKPVLIMDHQPKELCELSAAGADVCLCGHTHDGQMFPANIVTGAMWENPYGYQKKGRMHTIVTSGVGVFGPNMRVGTIAEICPVKIHFQ